MSALLTPELIASTIEQSPIQARIMLKLLLLQHFDITPEEITHIAADRPDPRCVAGSKPIHQVVKQDALRDVTSRRDEYRRRVRLRRRTALASNGRHEGHDRARGGNGSCGHRSPADAVQGHTRRRDGH